MFLLKIERYPRNVNDIIHTESFNCEQFGRESLILSSCLDVESGGPVSVDQLGARVVHVGGPGPTA